MTLDLWLKRRAMLLTSSLSLLSVLIIGTLSWTLFQNLKLSSDNALRGAVEAKLYDWITTRDDLNFRQYINRLIDETVLESIVVTFPNERVGIGRPVENEMMTDCFWIVCGYRWISIDRSFLERSIKVQLLLNETQIRNFLIFFCGVVVLSLFVIIVSLFNILKVFYIRLSSELDVLVTATEDGIGLETTLLFDEHKLLLKRLTDYQEKLKCLTEESTKNEVLLGVGKQILQFSHDIQSPLSLINVVAQNIHDAEKKGLLLAALDRIKYTSRCLLDFYRNPSDKSVNQEVDLCSIFERLKIEKMQIVKKNVEIQWECQLEGAVRLPNIDFSSIISNLVNNSIEAMENGTITVVAEQIQGAIVVSVLDDGPGIPKEISERILKGVRISTKSRNNDSGYALGLNSLVAILASCGAKLDIGIPAGFSHGTQVSMRFSL
jgi:signal transduction histidine kinase